MGVTCAGKSSFLSYAARNHAGVGLVEVGKALRAKYPASHFQGQAAPLHTQQEAWDLCCEATRAHLDDPTKRLVLIDGQPRDVAQVDAMFALPALFKGVRFVLLHCDPDVQLERARVRFQSDPEGLALATARIENDQKSYYRVLARLFLTPGFDRVHVVDTTRPLETWAPALLDLLLP